MSKNEGKFIVGIGAIIEQEETSKILLLHRNSDVEFAKDQWDDVGGRMYHFESPEETLLREIEEETGIKHISIVKPIDVSHYFRGERIAANEMVVITFWCRTPKKEVKLSREHDNYKWVLPNEALTLVKDQQLKRNIKKLIKEKKSLIEINSI
ncbi:MAG: NUDIX domain-containing protein [Candidatus Hodarchaeales archaeon]